MRKLESTNKTIENPQMKKFEIHKWRNWRPQMKKVKIPEGSWKFCIFYIYSAQNSPDISDFLNAIYNKVPRGLCWIGSAEIFFLKFFPDNRKNLGSPPPLKWSELFGMLKKHQNLPCNLLKEYLAFWKFLSKSEREWG